MTLGAGRHFLAIPGPSVIPDEVLRAMHRPATNIYEGPLVETAHSLYPDLKTIAGATGEAIIYIANGHGAWEGALANTLRAGDRALVLESGRFAVGWGDVGARMGVAIEVLNAPPRAGVDPGAVETRLRADPGGEIAAILVVQVDTASGVWNDIAAIRQAIDAAGHPALLMVDAIASLGCMPYRMDEWGVDVTVAATQKGLMTPPGLGFVFAGEKAVARHKSFPCPSSYWDWGPRIAPDVFYQLFAGTCPVHHLYALRQALDMILAEGLDAVFARHNALAAGVRAAVEAWGRAGPFEINIADPAARSDSVTNILTGEIDAARLRAYCEQTLGVTLGVGLGAYQGQAFRIGHMGHLNAPMVLGTLGAVETALGAMRAPHGGGGLEAAAATMAAAL